MLRFVLLLETQAEQPFAARTCSVIAEYIPSRIPGNV